MKKLGNVNRVQWVVGGKVLTNLSALDEELEIQREAEAEAEK